MIAAYLNTHRENGIQTRISFSCLVSHSLLLGAAWQKKWKKKRRSTTQNQKLLLQRIKQEIWLWISLPLLFLLLFLFLGSLFYSFPLPLNFRSVALRNLFQWIFSCRFRSYSPIPQLFAFPYALRFTSATAAIMFALTNVLLYRFCLLLLLLFSIISRSFTVVLADECFTNSSSFFIIFFLIDSLTKLFSPRLNFLDCYVLFATIMQSIISRIYWFSWRKMRLQNNSCESSEIRTFSNVYTTHTHTYSQEGITNRSVTLSLSLPWVE